MWFNREEMSAAARLRRLGIEWQPRPGLYVWDEQRRIRPGSPFQRGVYFLLDLDCFVNYFGGIAELKQAVVWLPTWEQCRLLLEESGTTSGEIAARLRHKNDLQLLTLYRLLEESLQARRANEAAKV